MSEKAMMMREMQQLAFSLNDLNLFLDTHPTDQNALALYKKQSDSYKALVDKYQKMYGPITALDGAGTNTWAWVNNPWPWEYDANMEV